MQYLAEVEKKSGGLLGGSKTALRLLACQKGPEEGWKTLSGDNNVVYTDKAGDRGSGALVMAELSGNDVRRVQSATRDIINMFKTHATLQGKLKGKDEDIEQWKESLTYQAQMLNQREVELQQREEQVQQMDEELVRLEQQREEVEAMRSEAQRLRSELDEKQTEVDAAWSNLQGQSGGGGALDEEQVVALQAQLDALASSMVAADGLQGRIQQMADQLGEQQPVLDEHWQAAEQSGEVEGGGNVAEQLDSLRNHWQGWYDGQIALAKMETEADGLRRDLRSKQHHSDALQRQLKAQELLQKQLTHLSGGIDPEISKQIDYEALENMPLDGLEGKVAELKKDYDRIFNFVNDQEEELRLQLQAIEELKTRIAEASEFDSLSLSTELADEQDSYRILDESMVDQRRTLHERQTVLEQHQAVLARRQGSSVAGGEEQSAADMAPILAQIEADAAQQKQQLDGVNAELESLETQLRDLTAQIEAKSAEQAAVKGELDKFDASFKSDLAAGGGGGAGDAYRTVLQPVQDLVNSLKQQCQETLGEVNHLKGVEEEQQQLLNVIRQSIADMQQKQSGAADASPGEHANPFSDAA